MIEQDLYIEILEMFDEIKEEPCYLDYKKAEYIVLNDKEILNKLDKLNSLYDEIAKITYKPYLSSLNKEIVDLEKIINSDIKYKDYLEKYYVFNERMKFLSSIIFKDIAIVEEKGCHACK